ncbi:4Fe-4S binding protein [Eubacteriales bacterium OttesenSCG-928-M02]|nr:4Fe-4S binding protein [Eubacteriales bacterium OttesenSCG-928-M02]
MVELQQLVQEANQRIILENPDNYIKEEDAMREDLVGIQMYEPAIFAVADANDPLFDGLKAEEVVHPEHLSPGEWLPGAKSVISFFLPFTQRVKEANGADMDHFVDEWLHARMDGEMVLIGYRNYIRDRLVEMGYPSTAPVSEKRFGMAAPRISNWSERHVGHIAGLGTFSMSKGLITQKGVAGRLCSVVTTAALPYTARAYTGLTDYCNECGLCAKNCPADAILPDLGVMEAKRHDICSPFLDSAKDLPLRGKTQKYRYGCGKCQVRTPCQDGIAPKRKTI